MCQNLKAKLMDRMENKSIAKQSVVIKVQFKVTPVWHEHFRGRLNKMTEIWGYDSILSFEKQSYISIRETTIPTNQGKGGGLLNHKISS